MSVVKITKENFDEVVKNEGTVLVDFYADWCGPCKMLAPVVHEIAEEQAGNFTVGKINIDESMELAQKYGVQSIPTLICFKNGEPVQQKVGVQSKENIIAMCR